MIENPDNTNDVRCPHCNAILAKDLAGWTWRTCDRCGHEVMVFRYGRILIAYDGRRDEIPPDVGKKIDELIRVTYDWTGLY